MSTSESQSEIIENDDDRCQTAELPMDEQSLMQRVEAVLFLASQPLPSRKLADLASLEDGTQARTMVKLLNQHYDKWGRAFHIKQIAGGYQLMTRPQFSTWLRRMEHIPQMVRLSTPAMETLAVVAYRQPVLKAEIEAIRGVNCGEMLRQLLDRGLVAIVGRSEELGRPYFYGTTKKFLETFGLSRIDALPRAEDLKGRGLPKSASLTQNETNSSSEKNETQSISDTLSFSTDPQTPMEESKVSVVDPQLASEIEENNLVMTPSDQPGSSVIQEDAPVASEDMDDDQWEDDDDEEEEWEDDEDSDSEWDEEEGDEESGDDDDDDGDEEYEEEEWDEEDGEYEDEESDDEYEDDEYEDGEYEDDDEEELEDHWEEVDDEDEEDGDWEESEDEDEEEWEDEDGDGEEDDDGEDEEDEWDED